MPSAMGTISAFVHVSVDGCFAGPNGEIDWFKSIGKDAEYEAYTHEQSSSGDTLLMGRTTYEMMKSYWPTEDARKNDPAMAGVMNDSPKIVFSRTLRADQDWKNVKVVREIDPAEILALKERGDATILGSGTIVRQFTNLRLIDRYQLIVVPRILGSGKPLFKDSDGLNLNLTESRSFRNGLVVLHYGS
jgi:dihydrofolate reductase